MVATEDKSVLVARAKLSEYLDSKKLRKTPERFAILDVVFSHNDHFGVETIFAEMEENSYHVSRSTVYNTMELFCDCGIVRKHQFGTQKALYEKVVSSGNHHHLICTECGKIKEMKDSELMRYISMRKYGTFTASYVSLYVYGICSTCARKQRRNKKTTK
jgi:Fur family ferric uptake transcriptional regulator